MKENVIKNKTFAFANDVIVTYKQILREKKEHVLSRQFLRSGTAIGALVREAEFAESRKDFIHKHAIALKEANETGYWIDLLSSSEYISISHANYLKERQIQILKILVKIVKTSKGHEH